LGVDRLTNLELFVRVAEAGGFTAVSRERALSQSSVSRKISELERWLGVQLLQRTTREVKLTEASQQLYQRSLALLSQVEDIESVIANSGTKTSGTLRLQASYEFGHAYVVPYVLDFMAEYPDINVDLRLNNRYVNLIEDGVDIAISNGQSDRSKHCCQKIVPGPPACRRLAGLFAATRRSANSRRSEKPRLRCLQLPGKSKSMEIFIC
jgi:DNA-binding transcriptional LysR family regulator